VWRDGAQDFDECVADLCRARSGWKLGDDDQSRGSLDQGDHRRVAGSGSEQQIAFPVARLPAIPCRFGALVDEAEAASQAPSNGQALPAAAVSASLSAGAQALTGQQPDAPEHRRVQRSVDGLVHHGWPAAFSQQRGDRRR
jgi:hypothetical protein